MNNQNSTDQNFDVFRYVSEEMTSAEEVRFEERLGEDQELRERVAKMVSTMATVDNVFDNAKVSPAVAARSAKLRARRLFVSAAALALMATLAIALIPQRESSESDAESIAIAWSEAAESTEFVLPESEDDFEFASIEFEDDADWISDAINLASEVPASLN